MTSMTSTTHDVRCALWVLALFGVACNDASGSLEQPEHTDTATPDAGAGSDAAIVDDPRRAPFPSPEWEVRAPEQQGLRKAGLDEALEYAFQPSKHTQGVVII